MLKLLIEVFYGLNVLTILHLFVYKSVASSVPVAATIIQTWMVCCMALDVNTFSCFLNNHFTCFYFGAAINPAISSLAPSVLTSSAAANLNIGVINPAEYFYQAFDPRFSNPMVMWKLLLYLISEYTGANCK